MWQQLRWTGLFPLFSNYSKIRIYFTLHLSVLLIIKMFVLLKIKVLKDCLLCMNLQWNRCREQCYNGASIWLSTGMELLLKFMYSKHKLSLLIAMGRCLV